MEKKEEAEKEVEEKKVIQLLEDFKVDHVRILEKEAIDFLLLYSKTNLELIENRINYVRREASFLNINLDYYSDNSLSEYLYTLIKAKKNIEETIDIYNEYLQE